MYQGGSSSVVAICTFDFSESQFFMEDESGIIAEGVLYECFSLTSITIPSSVTSIGNNSFADCEALESITFESDSSLESIGGSAFYQCWSLTSITLPSSVTSIGAGAFSECKALESITFESTTPPELDDGSLGIPTTCTIRVPQGTLSDYTSASNYPDPNDYTYVEY